MELSRPQSAVQRKSILNNQEDKIRQLYKQGLSGKEIAKQMGVSCDSIYRFIHKNHFAEFKRQGYDEELLKMRQEGMSLTQIGDYFGVSANTVLYRIRKLQQNNEYQNI